MGDHVDHGQAEALRLAVHVQAEPAGKPRERVARQVPGWARRGETSPALAKAMGMPWASRACLAASASAWARLCLSFSS